MSHLPANAIELTHSEALVVIELAYEENPELLTNAVNEVLSWRDNDIMKSS